jgi:hypothetical protein
VKPAFPPKGRIRISACNNRNTHAANRQEFILRHVNIIGVGHSRTKAPRFLFTKYLVHGPTERDPVCCIQALHFVTVIPQYLMERAIRRCPTPPHVPCSELEEPSFRVSPRESGVIFLCPIIACLAISRTPPPCAQAKPQNVSLLICN